jgi:DNA sulfur modification protein DndD
MIIKNITIENFLCYYGSKQFELAEGLNIILGENGEGKTKFFEAIDWLFNGDDRDLELLVSAKALEELEVGDSIRIRVSITAEQYGERKIISKSFIATKEKPNESSASNFMIEGVEENNVGERNQVDGQLLLDRIFPFQIRRYSMFKGEAELNILDSETALTNLINLFSDAKHYEKYSAKGEFLREKAEKAVNDSTKSDKKNEAKYKELEESISKLEQEKKKYEVHLGSTEQEIRKIEENLQLAEKHVNNADALETINKRIKGTEDKISSLYTAIDENYTTSLFDEEWITVNFEPIHHEFSNYINQLSLDKRKQQSEYDKQKGIQEGVKKAKAELLNNAVPLPIGIPSKAHLEEMLGEELCKVCNREAPRNSEPYIFMMHRLQEYLKTQENNIDDDTIDVPLFQKNFINRLESMSVNHEDDLKHLKSIRQNIQDLFEFNKERKNDIEELNTKLEKEKLERERILGNSSIAEEKLVDVLKNYNAWQQDLTKSNRDNVDYQAKLDEIISNLKEKRKEKDNIDLSSASSFLVNTRAILRDIETIFNETKEKKFNKFIEKLQTKSNSFFSRINIDAFTGAIVISKRLQGNAHVVDIELQEDGRTFYKPNQSLLTSMHISVLFAISELASETKEENFPMIFDAPTSSFGENKTAQFLNLIYSTDSQKILLIKDFLSTDQTSNQLSIKKEFDSVKRDKAFWVKLERPFDPNNLKTINTQVITL